jgi:hypothetical protein
MMLETKYELGDYVYCIYYGSIEKGQIEETIVTVHKNNGSTEIIIEYKVILTNKGTRYEHSNNIFLTKEEAGREWLKQQGLDCGLKG